MYEVLEIFLYFAIYHSHRHLAGAVLATSETLFDRSFSRQISIEILETLYFLPDMIKRYLRNYFYFKIASVAIIIFSPLLVW